jgi:hypothetical protein
MPRRMPNPARGLAVSASFSRAALQVSWAIGLLLILGGGPARAAQYEKPPVLPLSEAAPPELRKGDGFRVDKRVPTDGLTTRFTILSAAKPLEARGVETLALRASEVHAILELRKASKTKAFTKALGTTAMRPVKAAAHMAEHPVDTVKGIPSGVGRFFDRVGSGTKRVYAAATDSSKSGEDRAGEVASSTGKAAADAFGYEQERRNLARQLKVDPYTSNPELADLLDQFATAAFVGRVGLNTLITVVVPVSLALTTTSATNDLVWDTPRGDLVVRNETKLREMGVPDATIAALQKTPGFTLSIQTALVDQLARLDGVDGRTEVVELAATSQDTDQALFVTRATRMLADHHARSGKLAALRATGTVTGRETGGALVVPGPVDYVSWTERLDRFSKRDDLAAAQRGIWLTGRASPRAVRELEARGWTVHQGLLPLDTAGVTH